MFTKNDLKHYSSLLQKKFRKEEKKFLIEGIKLVEEAIQSNFSVEYIFMSTIFAESHSVLIKKYSQLNFEILNNKDFLKLTDTKQPQGIVAVVNFPEKPLLNFSSKKIAALENISDPGNLGTIIRTCDWFGIDQIIVSENSCEIYNPKVIRSAMGSIFHLNIFESPDFIGDLKELQNKKYKILCADIEGENIFNFQKREKSIIVFCNEANGPSAALLKLADKKITIPKSGKAESLNVASAAAIILAQITK